MPKKQGRKRPNKIKLCGTCLSSAALPEKGMVIFLDTENDINSVKYFSIENLSETDRRLLREIIEDTVTEILAAAGITGD